MTNSNSGEFEKAISEFEAALVVKPGDADATKAMENAKENLKKRKEELDALYNQRVALADKLFGEGNYSEAKTHYVKANSQRPDDAHPKNRIIECDTKIKEKESADVAAKEKRKNYDAAILKADELFKASKWDESIKQYEIALTHVDEQYPKGQIELAKSNRDNAANAAEAERKKKEQFTALLVKGDGEVPAATLRAAAASSSTVTSVRRCAQELPPSTTSTGPVPCAGTGSAPRTASAVDS
jgi:tetratricopeptide (TPR) repeat protein